MGSPIVDGIIIAAGGAIFGLLCTALYQKATGRTSEIRELRDRLIALETAFLPWKAAMETMAVKVLHHPEPQHKRRDRLMEKYLARQLDDEEAAELHQMFTDIIEGRVTGLHPGEVAAAMVMSASLEAARADQTTATARPTRLTFLKRFLRW